MHLKISSTYLHAFYSNDKLTDIIYISALRYLLLAYTLYPTRFMYPYNNCLVLIYFWEFKFLD